VNGNDTVQFKQNDTVVMRLTSEGHLLPGACNTYDLGSSNYRFKDLYLSGNTLDIGGTQIKRMEDTGALMITDDSGDAQSGYFKHVYVDGTIQGSNLKILGDFVTLDTITSNTEQMVITNAGTGPALKVTQTGANSIAEFYDDGNVLALKIADGGNVGIGTGVPQCELHINGTGAVIIPSGNSLQQPASPVVGMLRYNTDTNKLQYYNPFGWSTIGGVVAVGGNSMYELNNYRIHVFTSSGTLNINSGGGIEYLIVGGGGGGGSWVGGGGGAGGVLYKTSFVNAGSYSIIVGAGGIGSLNVGSYTGMPNGSKGGDSSMNLYIAYGGGMGASHVYNNTSSWMDGGSGGGNSGASHAVQGKGIAGQGFDGGIGHDSNPWSTGGGGGAGERGKDRVSGEISGNGGNGLYYGSQLGTTVGNNGWFGGGGGGGKHDAGGSAGTGGTGGGGGGVVSTTSKAANGMSNTGGGGGGSGNAGNLRSEGGNGGSGIVIIRYLL